MNQKNITFLGDIDQMKGKLKTEAVLSCRCQGLIVILNVLTNIDTTLGIVFVQSDCYTLHFPSTSLFILLLFLSRYSLHFVRTSAFPFGPHFPALFYSTLSRTSCH